MQYKLGLGAAPFRGEEIIIIYSLSITHGKHVIFDIHNLQFIVDGLICNVKFRHDN